MFLSNYEDAEVFFLRAMFTDKPYCNGYLATVYRLQENLVKARSFANNAIAQYKELKELYHFAWCLLELGEIEWSSKNIPAAKSCLTQARDEATKLGDDDLGHRCDRLLASIAIDEGDCFYAQILLDGARKEAALHNDPHNAALCDVLLGSIQE
jgi:tetratricopeptide (TPR) repeat protein